MAHQEIKTQAEARKRIARDAKDFLQTLDQDLGVFFHTWSLYEDLPLEKFKEATPNEDRMLLPGMEPPIDVPNIVIQALGNAWHQILNTQDPVSNEALSKQIYQSALRAGAPQKLADQLTLFVQNQYSH
jgi:hypothetical protein